jgi:hypothetical protein
LKAFKEKWGTHYDPNDLHKKIEELDKKKEDDLKAWEKNRGTD